MKYTRNAARTLAAIAQECSRQSANPWTYFVNGQELTWNPSKVISGCNVEVSIFRHDDGQPVRCGHFLVLASGVIKASGKCPVSWTDPAKRTAELKALLFYTDSDGQEAADMGEDADLWNEYEALTGEKPFSTFWA